MLILKTAFAIGLVGILVCGWYAIKNYDRIFGAPAEIPGETEGAVLLSKVQAWAIWLISIKVCVMMLFIL